MRSKSKNFYLGILESNYDIIILTETWLTVDFNDAEFFPPDFCVFRRDRYNVSTKRKGGGVLIAVRRIYCCELLYSDPNMEFIAVQVKLDTLRIIIGTVYFPPEPTSSLCQDFLDSITCNLLPHMGDNTDFVMFGDFNFPDLIWIMEDNILIPANTNDSSALFCDFMANMCTSQINSVPNSCGTYLDLIFYTNNRPFKLESCDDFAGYSSVYHTPVSFQLFHKNSINLNFTKNTTMLDFSHTDHSSLNNFLAEVVWADTLSNIDINSALDTFNDLLKDAIEKFVPKIIIKKSLTRSDPWFTKELKRLEVMRNKCHRKYRRSGLARDYIQFKQLRKQFCYLNRFLYNNYMVDIEDDLRRNPKKFWRFVKLRNHNNGLPSFLEFRGLKSDNPETICNFFAEYFSSVFVKDSSNAPKLSNSNNSKIVFSELDVMKALMNLDVSKGPGPDGLPASLFKQCAVGFAAPLCHLFNLSLRQGRFPDLWKISNIIPIHKNGPRSEVTNYRGIAILSCMPKLFESMVNNVLYFNAKQCISRCQHGFFPGRSTVTNLTVFLNNLINSVASKIQVDVVYTDFAKAFDKLNHRILLRKLSELNCDIIPLNWLMSYLSNRKMYVKIDDTLSEYFFASSGVPQGSHLGPLLFLLFINDVVECFKFADCILFADDMKIFANISCELDRVQFQQDLNTFCDWCATNLMFLNVDKCHVITYSRSKSPVAFDYFLNDVKLRRVNVVNDLGVIFSSDLTFNSHIDAVVNKAYSMLGFIKRNSKDFHDTLTFKSLYTSFVRSQLEYATVIWSPFYVSHGDRIESVQKQFLLFVLRRLPSLERDINNFKLPPYVDRCRFLGLQSLSARRTCANATFARDIICGKIDCADLLSCFNIYAPQRCLRPRELLHIPTAISNYSFHGPIARIQRDFNTVSNGFDFNISRDEFKKRVAEIFYLV